MTNIVCVGDIHVSDRAPANATDTYTDDIIDILKWVADYAYNVEADAVVWAGDVFHHKSPSRNSHELVLKMIDVVKYHRVPLWCVTGNHDVQNGIVEHVRSRQPLGVLYEAGLQELVGWHPTLPLFGVPWRETWTEDGDPELAFDQWLNPPAGSRINANPNRSREEVLARCLAVTHAPIYPPGEADKQMFDLVPLSGPDGLSAAMGNQGFLYYGHIHEDHGIFTVDGVTYANMGAISRGSLHEYNLTRSIKVALWTSGTEGVEALSNPVQPGFIEVPVPHKPADEVFRISEAALAKDSKVSLEEFLVEVGQKQLDISSTGSVVEHIRTRTDVPEPVKKRAISILEELA